MIFDNGKVELAFGLENGYELVSNDLHLHATFLCIWKQYFFDLRSIFCLIQVEYLMQCDQTV